MINFAAIFFFNLKGKRADDGKMEEEEGVPGRVVLSVRGGTGRLRQKKRREMCLAPYCRRTLLTG